MILCPENFDFPKGDFDVCVPKQHASAWASVCPCDAGAAGLPRPSLRLRDGSLIWRDLLLGRIHSMLESDR